ncbi:MAG: hypothetical protein U0R70_14560 [Solirubrobacteraceae bacterium]
MTRLVTPGLWLFAGLNLALAVWMAADPRSFYDTIADFGPYNPHDLRDVATWQAAAGLALAGAARWPAWRVPVLAFVAVQSGLHTVNHLADVGAAATTAMGVFDVASLALATAALCALLAASAGTAAGPRRTALRPRPGRAAEVGR